MLDRPSVGDDRSARDVLFTLLLVVFVIVVTALAATVILDMEQDPVRDEMAGVSVVFDDDEDAIHVSFTAMARPGTTLDVSVENASTDRMVASVRLASVGQSHTIDGLDEGVQYRVVAVAEWRDKHFVTSIRLGHL